MNREDYSFDEVRRNSKEDYCSKLGIGGLSFDPSIRKEPDVPMYFVVGINKLGDKSRQEILIASSKGLIFIVRRCENVCLQD